MIEVSNFILDIFWLLRSVSRLPRSQKAFKAHGPRPIKLPVVLWYGLLNAQNAHHLRPGKREKPHVLKSPQP